jgi:hypothetical protein
VGGCAPGGRARLRRHRAAVTLLGRMDTTSSATVMHRPPAGELVVVIEALLLGLFLLLIL